MDTLRMNRKADLSVLYDADRRLYDCAWLAAHGMTEQGFIARYRDCPSVGFEYGGIPFGGVILHGDEVHLAILPEFHGKWGTLLRPALAWLFSGRSEVRARVHRPNRQCLRFLRRLGAKQVGSDDNFIIFRICPREIVPGLWRPRPPAQD